MVRRMTLAELKRAQRVDALILFTGTVMGVAFSGVFPAVVDAMKGGSFTLGATWWLLFGSLVVAMFLTLQADRDRMALPDLPASERYKIMKAKVSNRRKRFANNFYAGFAWQAVVGEISSNPPEVITETLKPWGIA